MPGNAGKTALQNMGNFGDMTPRAALEASAPLSFREKLQTNLWEISGKRAFKYKN